jgi:hypothetical protein
VLEEGGSDGSGSSTAVATTWLRALRSEELKRRGLVQPSSYDNGLLPIADGLQSIAEGKELPVQHEAHHERSDKHAEAYLGMIYRHQHD